MRKRRIVDTQVIGVEGYVIRPRLPQASSASAEKDVCTATGSYIYSYYVSQSYQDNLSAVSTLKSGQVGFVQLRNPSSGNVDLISAET
jgi:hypothetical protein